MYDYTEALVKVVKRFCPWAKNAAVERAVYYFLLNLIHKANLKQQIVLDNEKNDT